MRGLSTALVIAFSSVVLAFGAAAAGKPANSAAYKPPLAAANSESGFYLWVDGMYDRVKVPTYALGYRQFGAAVTYPGTEPIQVFNNPRLDGWGVRGVVGYRPPGSNIRWEIGASYVQADSTASQTSLGQPPAIGLIYLSGTGATLVPGCFAFALCSVTGTLNTDYDAWQINGKAAYDWRLNSIVVTPALTLFGGHARNHQTLTQSMVSIVVCCGQYSADTSLTWTDFGTRAGLNVNFPLTSWISVGAGGWIGVANRDVSLSGNDSGIAVTGAPTIATTFSASAHKAVFLANAEAGFVITPLPMVTLRGFVGLNYDDDVPGLSAPSGVGGPAGILFAHETSYYAGGGLLVQFGG